MFTKPWEQLEQLSPQRLAIVTAIAGSVITLLLQNFGVPFVKWIVSKLSNLFYPYISGMFVVDSLWSLPRYIRSIQQELGELSNPWLSKPQKLTDIFVPVHAAEDANEISPDISRLEQKVSEVPAVNR
jgi:hypothetical protein